METVIQALEKMGRASYREVASRLDIEPVEALKMLREQRDQGLCDFADGGWFVGKLKNQQSVARPAPAAKPKPLLQGAEPEPIDPAAIQQLLEQNGAMTTVALATAVGRNARGMTSVMVSLARQGIVDKNGQGKGVTWSLPVMLAEPVPTPEVPAVPEAEKPLEQFVSEIPAFTERRATGQQIPTVRVISREIRRTRNKLEQLTRLRDAARVLSRHKDLVQQLVKQEADDGQ